MIAATLKASGKGGGRTNDHEQTLIANGLTRRYGKGTDSDATDSMVVANTLRANERNTSQGPGNYVAAPLSHGSNPNSNAAGRRREDDENLVAFDSAFGRNSGVFDDETPPLKIGSGVGVPAGPAISNGAGVRRLTPTECCRLQGFPDDWLGEPNEPPDSPRYAALGDAVTVNVAQWIGERIMEAEAA